MPPLFLTRDSMNLLEALEKYSDKQLVLHCYPHNPTTLDKKPGVLIPLTLLMPETEFKDNFPKCAHKWNNMTFKEFLNLEGSFHIGALSTYGSGELHIQWHHLVDLI